MASCGQPQQALTSIPVENQQESTPTSLSDTLGSAEDIVGRRVRALRVMRGWSQQELATRMSERGQGWRQTTVAKTEAADRPIRVNEVQALAVVFGVTAGDLLSVPIDDFEMASAAVRLTELQALLEAANQRVLETRRVKERADAELAEAEAACAAVIDELDEQRREYEETKKRVEHQEAPER